MADNKRSKKLIGGIIGGPVNIVGGVVSRLLGKKKKSLPSAANSLLGKIFKKKDSLDSGKTITDQDTATTEEKRNKKLGFLAGRNPVAGAILPNGGVGILTNSDNIIPLGGEDTGGTVNQNSNVSFKISANQNGAAVFVNGENTYKTTPNTLGFTLSDVVKDGSKTITLQKEGYTSTTAYIVTAVQNPDFNETALDSYENDLIQQDSLINIGPKRNKRIYTQTPAYVFKIEKYINGVLQSTDGTLDNNEIKELVFEVTTQTAGQKGGSDSSSTNILTITLDGPDNSVIVSKDGGADFTKLLKGRNTIVSDIGSTYSISSTNLNLYKVNKIVATAEGFNPSTLLPENAESLTTKITLDANYTIDIVSEQFSTVQNTSPIIQFENPIQIRKYNLNSKTEYPITITSLNDSPITKITAYVGESKFEFDDVKFLTSKSGGLLGVLNASKGPAIISIPAEAFKTIGNYKVFIVPSNGDGDGDSIQTSISVVDEFYVGVPDLRNIIYPSELIGPDYAGTNVNFDIEYESENTDFVRIYVGDSTTFIQEKSDGKLELNLKTLLNVSGTNVSEDEQTISLILKLVPYNISGVEQVVGKTEVVKINFNKGTNQIPRNLAINRVADIFTSQLDDSIFAKETSKYLTHLLHFPDGDTKVITTWTGSEGSLIAKLYEPIPTTIQPNEEVFISKLISNPIVETVRLITETTEVCNTLKGPNFSVEPDNGIEYQIYEDLVASGSVTSTDLVNQYASTLGIDTSKLNIQYVSGSTYLFENFINFSSAVERLDNFFYKVQLIEYYKNKYEGLTSTFIPPYGGYDGGIITQDGYQMITEDGIFDIQWEIAQYQGVAQMNEAKKIFGLLNELIRGMDGYEKFLYTSNNTLAYPKTLYIHPTSGLGTYILKQTTHVDVITWYSNILSLSSIHDLYNPNLLTNNIPQFIKEDSNNKDFSTFLHMIGQHFDIIWAYIGALSRMKQIEASETKGIANTLVQHMLESLGWDTKKAFDSQFLWEYIFGTNKDGVQKYSMPLKNANEQIWRRILNNLPYILKHKGTGRAMKAIMACYGVPSSLLTIMEFGGPQDPTKGGSTKFTFDDRTAALYLSGNSAVKVPWKYNAGSLSYPNCVEFRILPDSTPSPSYTLISGSEWNLDLVQTTGSFVKLELNFGGDASSNPYFAASGPNTPYIETTIEYVYGSDLVTQSLDFPISNENYSNVVINRHNYPGNSSLYEVWLATSDGKRITTFVSMSILTDDNQWETGSFLHLSGDNFNGNFDEFRLWTVPLQRSKFENHTLFPDAINGNSYTASTADLIFRLDFEYPKDRTITENIGIKNVSISDNYGEEFAYAENMYSASLYPYQYTPYERTVTADVPSVGFGFANKIRFEDQTLVTDLSYKNRATKKSFDQAPIDSNRLGLFFSPIKELNMDILKTFGEFNIDNYIGDPSDEYKDTYRELDTLRHYYFERLDRNINEYIQLVRYIDKSLFDVLADLAPARAKVSKGLLIEPHYLERSKTRWKKPESERNDYETIVSIQDNNEIESSYESKEGNLDATNISNITGEKNNYDSVVDANDVYSLEGFNPNYDSTIDYNFDNIVEATAPFYNTLIECPTGETLTGEVDSFKFEQIGMELNSLANAGFGLYANRGTGIIRKFDSIFGNSESTGSRQNIYLVKKQYTQKVSTQIAGYPRSGSQPGERVRYADIDVIKYKYEVSTLPFSGSIAISPEIAQIKALNGYFPTHYKFVNNLGEGLQRMYFKGSLQTSATTPDGLSPVEIFTTNPNILRVAKTGRGSGEPILEVD
jgi:hypothetical protein